MPPFLSPSPDLGFAGLERFHWNFITVSGGASGTVTARQPVGFASLCKTSRAAFLPAPGTTLGSEADFLGSSPGFVTVSNLFIPSAPQFSYRPRRVGVSSSHRVVGGSMKSKLFS